MTTDWSKNTEESTDAFVAEWKREMAQTRKLDGSAIELLEANGFNIADDQGQAAIGGATLAVRRDVGGSERLFVFTIFLPNEKRLTSFGHLDDLLGEDSEP